MPMEVLFNMCELVEAATARSVSFTSFDNGTNDLVNVNRAVELVCILSSDQITIENDQLLILRIEDFIEDFHRIDVLLRSLVCHQRYPCDDCESDTQESQASAYH